MINMCKLKSIITPLIILNIHLYCKCYSYLLYEPHLYTIKGNLTGRVELSFFAVSLNLVYLSGEITALEIV